MTTVTTFPLPDGPIIGCDQVITDRAAMIYRMARELVEDGTWGDHSASIVSLIRAGFASFEITANIVNVRQVAQQHSEKMKEIIGG